MTTADTAHVALPPGAVPGDEDDWKNWNYEYRVISSADFIVAGTDVEIHASGLQLPDGTVDDGTGPADEAPKVWINNAYALTPTQAREMAAQLCHFAGVIDRWSGGAGAPVSDCEFEWCGNTGDRHKEHTWTDGVDGSSLAGKLRRVSVWNSIDVQFAEPIMIGIEGDPTETDDGEEAWLSLDQAVYLRDTLSRAIENARTAASAGGAK